MTAARHPAPPPVPLHVHPELGRIERLAYSAAEAGEALGIDRSTVYELINAGELRAFHAGRRLLISREALVEWIHAREVAEKLR